MQPQMQHCNTPPVGREHPAHLLVVYRYWTVDPKSDKLEALAVPSALQQSMVSHSGSLALASLLFTVFSPLQVPVFNAPTRHGNSSLQGYNPLSLRQPAILQVFKIVSTEQVEACTVSFASKIM